MPNHGSLTPWLIVTHRASFAQSFSPCALKNGREGFVAYWMPARLRAAFAPAASHLEEEHQTGHRFARRSCNFVGTLAWILHSAVAGLLSRRLLGLMLP
jgi:hypothetical protein